MPKLSVNDRYFRTTSKAMGHFNSFKNLINKTPGQRLAKGLHRLERAYAAARKLSGPARLWRKNNA